MALSTGELVWIHSINFSPVTGLTNTIGGTGNLSNPVVFNSTGIFPTGQSSIPGGSTQHMYAKLFLANTGNASDDRLSNPIFYFTNVEISDQIYMAPDPFYLGVHAAQTGTSANRVTLPGGLSASHFSGYSYETPLDLSSVYGSTVTLGTGQSIGIWLRRSIQPGLSSSNNNSFSIVVRGDI